MRVLEARRRLLCRGVYPHQSPRLGIDLVSGTRRERLGIDMSSLDFFRFDTVVLGEFQRPRLNLGVGLFRYSLHRHYTVYMLDRPGLAVEQNAAFDRADLGGSCCLELHDAVLLSPMIQPGHGPPFRILVRGNGERD